MSNTFDKLSVLESFIEEVNSYLPEIETNLERLARLPGDMGALEETYRRTHTIGGSASMMDFPGLAHVAHGMEDILGDALDGLTTLDEPTIGLLRRSLGRLHQLLEGIRNGVDDEAVVKEDDADYERYRAGIEASIQPVPNEIANNAENDTLLQDMAFMSSSQTTFDSPTFESFKHPSLDEVLKLFQTPASLPGESMAWPEESASRVSFEESPPEPAQFELPVSPTFVQPFSNPISALDELVASTRPASASLTPPSSAYVSEQDNDDIVHPVMPLYVPDENEYTQPYITSSNAEVAIRDHELPPAYEDMQKNAQELVTQASSLKSTLTQLRTIMSVVEAQRSEFKGFLDGSKDALDRMEDWAGQAMGLNLRNSPEHVRRYLPLSVMWVANSKLKKVLSLLLQIVGGVEVTDEQLETTLRQLQGSLISCREAFLQMQTQSSQVMTQEPGWTAWNMQVARDASTLSERVTLERHGDIAALRAEIEATLREELSREYEPRPSVQALRAELEQQIRNELSLEAQQRQRFQGGIGWAEDDVSLQEYKNRLRHEVEIQVRQEFLSQITNAAGDANSILNMPTSSSSILDRTPEAINHTTSVSLTLPSSPPSSSSTQLPLPVPQPASTPNPSAGSKSASAYTFGGDFGEEAADIFREEAEGYLQTISVHVAGLEKDPSNRDLLQGVRRVMHTLKGAAGMMGFRTIADLCHVSEDLLDRIMDGTITFSSTILSIIFDTAEALDILVASRGLDVSADEAQVQGLHTRYAELLGEFMSVPHNSVDEYIDVDGNENLVNDAAFVTGIVGDNQTAGTSAQRPLRDDLNVSVRLQKLDELVNLFGELLVNRSVLEERIERLVRLVSDVGVSSNRLRDVGQRLESSFEAAALPSGRSVLVVSGEGKQQQQPIILSSNNKKNNQSNVELSYLSEFDELELDRYTEFHQLARGLSEGISDMGTLSSEMDAVIRECESVFARENRLSATFQDRLMKVRLVPLSTMTPRLYRAARAVALKQRKEFDFLLEGDATEVDRTVYEEIAGPLLHLIRNAVNHALETPEVRTQKGKSPVGQIKLAASYEGNQVVITVRDDGKGIDPEHVRQTAIARGFIRPDETPSDHELIELIFQPGFTTAEVLSEESGRGVGLDVVRDSVSRLRGTLEVESMLGQGTAFTMKFPTTLAIQSAMLVRVGGQQFAIPTSIVESVGRLDNFKRATQAGQPAVVAHGDLYPLASLAQYLSLPVGSFDDKAQLLLVNAGGKRVALMVDEVKGKSDIVMKNLGPHLRNVHGIAGGTILGNGRVLLILELSDLLPTRAGIVTNISKEAAMPTQRYEAPLVAEPQGPVRQTIGVSAGKQAVAGAGSVSPLATPTAERGKHILVVDDSPSVRRVVSNMLRQHDWETQMARDGVEALDMISVETPSAVLLDIEMPRMDGYELIATIRAQEEYRTLPLIVLTSRAAAKHQQRAMQLGANAYLVKPYQDEELIKTINSLVYGASVS